MALVHLGDVAGLGADVCLTGAFHARSEVLGHEAVNDGVDAGVNEWQHVDHNLGIANNWFIKHK